MSIQDITKMSALYAQPSQFDQAAWKSAFDIYNAFTNAEDQRTQANDNFRKHQENLATSDWRVNQLNAHNQASVAKEKNTLMEQQGLAQLFDAYKKYGVKSDGSLASIEDIFQLSHQGLNPFAFSKLLGENQKYAQGIAQEVAPLNPALASNYRAYAGLTPFTIDPNGDIINLNTQALVGTLKDDDLINFGAGNLWTNRLAQLKAQQEALKAEKVAEARLPFTLAAINARSEAAENKQENWIELKGHEKEKEQLSKLIHDIVVFADGEGDERLNNISVKLAELAKQNPELIDFINKQAGQAMASPY